MSSSGSSSTGEGEEDWSDWIEEAQPVRSLWDDTLLPTATEAVQHDARIHGFDIVEHSARLGLDYYGYMRLVNYIRAEKPSPAEAKALSRDAPLFTEDAYLKPALEDDALLQVDYDDLAAALVDQGKGKAPASSTAEIDRIRDLEDQLSSLHAALAKLRVDSRATLLDDGDEPGPSSRPSKRALDDDTHYFKSYSTNGIHEDMLKDAVRTDAYRDFLSNRDVFAGKVVLDVGCGTGILSMFAARAGAKKVYAVDASQIASAAKRNVAENDLDQVIEVFHGKVEDLQLPEPVDIIVSEYMGYFLLYESMLDSVLHARDRFLKPGGLMAPSQCSILLAGGDDAAFMRDRIDYWRDVYGFKMSTMQEELYEDAIIDVVTPEGLMTRSCAIKDIHVTAAHVRDVDFEAAFTLTATRTGTLRLLCAHFDTFFTLDGRLLPSLALEASGAKAALRPGEVGFTTGPRGTKTHWAQTVFLLREPIEVTEGAEVRGTMRVRKAAGNTRELVVGVALEGRKEQVWNVR